MGYKLVFKKVISIGLLFLFAICIIVSTITLTSTTPWTDKEFPSNGPIEIITGKFIVKVTPTITWNNPDDIVYGTPLSNDQLDASASDPISRAILPGTYVYIPPLGKVLSVGQHQLLSVSFAPTDTVHYNSATGTAHINVIPIPPVPNPALKITKKASPSSYDHVGQTITYTYTITNSGNVDIKGSINVTDDKVGTVSIQGSGILSPGSSVTGTATYKITDADINTGSVTNLAYATDSSNNQPIISPINIVIIHYKHPTNNINNNGGSNDGFGPGPMMGGPMMGSPMMGGPGPMMGGPGPMMSGPIYGNEPYGYGSELSGTTEVPNSDSNGHKTKAHLSKHKHKNHSKHHKTKKNY